MRVLIFHGYLLSGTGSNVYNASLAQALAGMGHEVHLLCQERNARELEWVNAVGSWEGGTLEVETVRPVEGTGSVTVYVSDIGDVLPVYVLDEYPGFKAKAFAALSDGELDHYLAANVAAVQDVVAAAGAPDAALANHLVMGPLILARAGLRFAAKIHGSALEYTVRPNPRFLPHAREGIRSAAGVLVGSRHTAESLWRTLDDPDLPVRTRLGPPGVDVARFVPREPHDAAAGVRDLAGRLSSAGPTEAGLGRDPARAADALERFAGADAGVVYVGKLIVSKGVDLLLAAWPLVVEANPGARLLIVGFGELQGSLERVWDGIAAGDLGPAGELARRGWALEGGPDRQLPILSSFLADPPAGYEDAAGAAAGSVDFAGRLEHDEVADVLPAAQALVFPSTFPEAFGMVAAEAAACGVLPVSADHSGLREVSAALDEALEPDVAGLTSFPLDTKAVFSIAARLNAWLALDPESKARARRALVSTVGRLWSWERVATGVIAASAGELDGLPRVPGD